jgi:hypothetical protein
LFTRESDTPLCAARLSGNSEEKRQRNISLSSLTDEQIERALGVHHCNLFSQTRVQETIKTWLAESWGVQVKIGLTSSSSLSTKLSIASCSDSNDCSTVSNRVVFRTL